MAISSPRTSYRISYFSTSTRRTSRSPYPGSRSPSRSCSGMRSARPTMSFTFRAATRASIGARNTCNRRRSSKADGDQRSATNLPTARLARRSYNTSRPGFDFRMVDGLSGVDLGNGARVPTCRCQLQHLRLSCVWPGRRNRGSTKDSRPALCF